MQNGLKTSGKNLHMGLALFDISESRVTLLTAPFWATRRREIKASISRKVSGIASIRGAGGWLSTIRATFSVTARPCCLS